MEWVVTTGKSVAEAKDRALDQLGVATDEAEFEIVEEPKTGLFGRVKTEARVRARVKPTQVRPKQDRRDRRRTKSKGRKGGQSDQRQRSSESSSTKESASSGGGGRTPAGGSDSTGAGANGKTGGGRQRPKQRRQPKEEAAMSGVEESNVSPDEVGNAAVAFMTGLVDAFGADADAEVSIDDTDIDVRLAGDELGLLIGPGGRTLTAVQDLARVAAQRKLGDHETRLRIDVGGYREKRREALERFAVAVANTVVEQGRPKALEPMSSADRKAVHDAITDVEGVTSRSEGDDPNRRVVISPA